MLSIPSLRFLAPWLLAVLLPHAVLGQPAATADTHEPAVELTLEAAFVEAFARSPILVAARAEVEEARGRLRAAQTFLYNPNLGFELGDRQGSGDGSTDWTAALTQQFEVGGQRGKRTEAAELELASVEAGYLRVRRLLAASVAMAFAEAKAAEDLAEVAETESELAREVRSVTRRRYEAGAATQVEINLALASTARTERRTETARAVALEARSLLAEVIGLDPAMPPDPAGTLDLPAGEPLPLDALVEGALERRADLEAFRQAREASEARLRLAKAGRAPDLSVGAFYAEEEGTDRIVGGLLSIGLPIFNRQRGEIEEAKASIARTAAEAASQELAVRREVFAFLAHYQAARRSVEQLREQVVGNLEASLHLLGRSFTAGKIGLSDLLVSRRELIAARREFTEAATTAWNARIALDLAVGQLPGVAPADVSEQALEATPTPVPHDDSTQETLR